jgi:hypothetical protein
VIFAIFCAVLIPEAYGRRARVEYPEALYHVITRGNRRQRTFRKLNTEISRALALLKPSEPWRNTGAIVADCPHDVVSEACPDGSFLRSIDGTVKKALA